MIHRNSLSSRPALAAFLGENGVLRIVRAHGLDDFPLGLRVDLGDEVVLALGAHVEAMHAVHAADDDFAGAARGANGDVQKRLHAGASLVEGACGSWLKSGTGHVAGVR